MTPRPRSCRWAPLAVAILSLCPATARSQSEQQVLLRQLVGDLALDVRTAPGGALRVGAADSIRSVVVPFLQTDLRRWADSATKILAARAPRRGQSARWEAVVAGPGLAAGSMALARSIAPGDTAIVLLITNADFEAVRTRVTMAEARGFVGAIRKVSVAKAPG